MRTRSGALALVASTSLAGVSLVVACSDAPDARAPFTPDATPDGTANLPEASAALDSGAEGGRPQRPPFDPADEPVVCAGVAEKCAVELVAGRNHFCARMNDGTVRCWGDPRFGATGGAPPSDGGGPPAVRAIEGLTGVTQLGSAGATTCARKDDGTAWCWGSNQAGQLGLDGTTPSSDTRDHPVPSKVDLRELVTRIDVGPRAVCAVLEAGGVACWGDNQQQQIQSPASGTTAPTTFDAGGFALTKASIGTTTSFGLTEQGDLTSWGALNGRMGAIGGRLASLSPEGRPAVIAGLHDITSFAASATLERNEEGKLGEVNPAPPPPGGALPHAHACAIAAGEVYCWGRSDFGALCTGLLDVERLPAHAPITGREWPQQIAVGDEITCVRMTDGSIRCCGAEHRGRLGGGYSPLFTPIEAFEGYAVHVATSHRAVCALLKDGGVECWGSNQYGELGQGAPDQEAHPTPVKVAF